MGQQMEKPPPYNSNFNTPADYGHGQGQVYPSLGQGGAVPPPSYGVPVATTVMYNSPTAFGPEPVTTVCNNCHANITTSTHPETGLVAWISAGVLCAVGFWCCFWIPLAMNSLKDVTHKCPSCNAVVGKHRGK